MNLEGYGVLYLEALSRTWIAVPEGTLLYRVADEVVEMATAYHSDGVVFLRTGDVVNALAAFAYGLGWLDAGSRLGLLEPLAAHPPDPVDACIPDSRSAHLDEKTHRYRRMLDSALSMVETGPDQASPLYAGAETLRSTAQSWYAEGVELLDAGDRAGALARFSYGYAWLDAGIRAGLFRITGERGLFTV
ncbi:DUF357 domain-containing protein [Methanoculleus sp. YWC-01]|jgi:hypothetical protein|uniref:DUF357 domain-containing protein n=1 Tax=Methanoculleus nereidis TaxID=2735141 RepID=A0ABU3Z5K5_9EURY|nr:DUF357 domain-containing protein [Methanoculleus sp. YWC-01]MCK9306384.1 DUF357 domain-containing protein [Methanoculleus sp.]MDV4344085.1 DUF357 domain-containing protein [Methanoculleus sp. YWC-01]PKL56753.1 MAG: DUF357 domain-containing protein [Methanomicrobiales archaeon HGW-Methanomicrobiales-6]